MEKINVINEIKTFLEGKNENDDLNYIVNVEAYNNNRYAQCIIHRPNESPKLREIEFEPFMYIKDFKKNNVELYNGDTDLIKIRMLKYGITIKKMKTGNQKRLENGFCYKVTTKYSFSHISNFLRKVVLINMKQLRILGVEL